MTIDMIGILQTIIAGLVLTAVIGIFKINQKLYQLTGRSYFSSQSVYR